MKPDDKALTDHILADPASTTYRLATRWKVICIVLGVLCTVMIVLIPFAVLMFIIASKARVVASDDGLVVKWIGTRVMRWSDFASFEQMPFNLHIPIPGLGLAAAAAAGAATGAASAMVSGPLRYTLKNKKSGNIAAHWMAGSVGLVATMEAKTGMIIVPRRAPKNPQGESADAGGNQRAR